MANLEGPFRGLAQWAQFHGLRLREVPRAGPGELPGENEVVFSRVSSLRRREDPSPSAEAGGQAGAQRRSRSVAGPAHLGDAGRRIEAEYLRAGVASEEVKAALHERGAIPPQEPSGSIADAFERFGTAIDASSSNCFMYIKAPKREGSPQNFMSLSLTRNCSGAFVTFLDPLGLGEITVNREQFSAFSSVAQGLVERQYGLMEDEVRTTLWATPAVAPRAEPGRSSPPAAAAQGRRAARAALPRRATTSDEPLDAAGYTRWIEQSDALDDEVKKGLKELMQSDLLSECDKRTLIEVVRSGPSADQVELLRDILFLPKMTDESTPQEIKEELQGTIANLRKSPEERMRESIERIEREGKDNIQKVLNAFKDFDVYVHDASSPAAIEPPQGKKLVFRKCSNGLEAKLWHEDIFPLDVDHPLKDVSQGVCKGIQDELHVQVVECAAQGRSLLEISDLPYHNFMSEDPKGDVYKAAAKQIVYNQSVEEVATHLNAEKKSVETFFTERGDALKIAEQDQVVQEWHQQLRSDVESALESKKLLALPMSRAHEGRVVNTPGAKRNALRDVFDRLERMIPEKDNFVLPFSVQFNDAQGIPEGAHALAFALTSDADGSKYLTFLDPNLGDLTLRWTEFNANALKDFSRKHIEEAFPRIEVIEMAPASYGHDGPVGALSDLSLAALPLPKRARLTPPARQAQAEVQQRQQGAIHQRAAAPAAGQPPSEQAGLAPVPQGRAPPIAPNTGLHLAAAGPSLRALAEGEARVGAPPAVLDSRAAVGSPQVLVDGAGGAQHAQPSQPIVLGPAVATAADSAPGAQPPSGVQESSRPIAVGPPQAAGGSATNPQPPRPVVLGPPQDGALVAVGRSLPVFAPVDDLIPGFKDLNYSDQLKSLRKEMAKYHPDKIIGSSAQEKLQAATIWNRLYNERESVQLNIKMTDFDQKTRAHLDEIFGGASERRAGGGHGFETRSERLAAEAVALRKQLSKEATGVERDQKMKLLEEALGARQKQLEQEKGTPLQEAGRALKDVPRLSQVQLMEAAKLTVAQVATIALVEGGAVAARTLARKLTRGRLSREWAQMIEIVAESGGRFVTSCGANFVQAYLLQRSLEASGQPAQSLMQLAGPMFIMTVCSFATAIGSYFASKAMDRARLPTELIQAAQIALNAGGGLLGCGLVALIGTSASAALATSGCIGVVGAAATALAAWGAESLCDACGASEETGRIVAHGVRLVGSVATGALAGAVFGPVGAVVGAAVAFLVGLFTIIWDICFHWPYYEAWSLHVDASQLSEHKMMMCSARQIYHDQRALYGRIFASMAGERGVIRAEELRSFLEECNLQPRTEELKQLLDDPAGPMWRRASTGLRAPDAMFAVSQLRARRRHGGSLWGGLGSLPQPPAAPNDGQIAQLLKGSHGEVLAAQVRMGGYLLDRTQRLLEEQLPNELGSLKRVSHRGERKARVDGMATTILVEPDGRKGLFVLAGSLPSPAELDPTTGLPWDHKSELVVVMGDGQLRDRSAMNAGPDVGEAAVAAFQLLCSVGQLGNLVAKSNTDSMPFLDLFRRALQTVEVAVESPGLIKQYSESTRELCAMGSVVDCCREWLAGMREELHGLGRQGLAAGGVFESFDRLFFNHTRSSEPVSWLSLGPEQTIESGLRRWSKGATQLASVLLVEVHGADPVLAAGGERGGLGGRLAGPWWTCVLRQFRAPPRGQQREGREPPVALDVELCNGASAYTLFCVVVRVDSPSRSVVFRRVQFADGTDPQWQGFDGDRCFQVPQACMPFKYAIGMAYVCRADIAAVLQRRLPRTRLRSTPVLAALRRFQIKHLDLDGRCTHQTKPMSAVSHIATAYPSDPNKIENGETPELYVIRQWMAVVADGPRRAATPPMHHFEVLKLGFDLKQVASSGTLRGCGKIKQILPDKDRGAFLTTDCTVSYISVVGGAIRLVTTHFLPRKVASICLDAGAEENESGVTILLDEGPAAGSPPWRSGALWHSVPRVASYRLEGHRLRRVAPLDSCLTKQFPGANTIFAGSSDNKDFWIATQAEAPGNDAEESWQEAQLVPDDAKPLTSRFLEGLKAAAPGGEPQVLWTQPCALLEAVYHTSVAGGVSLTAWLQELHRLLRAPESSAHLGQMAHWDTLRAAHRNGLQLSDDHLLSGQGCASGLLEDGDPDVPPRGESAALLSLVAVQLGKPLVVLQPGGERLVLPPRLEGYWCTCVIDSHADGGSKLRMDLHVARADLARLDKVLATGSQAVPLLLFEVVMDWGAGSAGCRFSSLYKGLNFTRAYDAYLEALENMLGQVVIRGTGDPARKLAEAMFAAQQGHSPALGEGQHAACVVHVPGRDRLASWLATRPAGARPEAEAAGLRLVATHSLNTEAAHVNGCWRHIHQASAGDGGLMIAAQGRLRVLDNRARISYKVTATSVGRESLLSPNGKTGTWAVVPTVSEAYLKFLGERGGIAGESDEGLAAIARGFKLSEAQRLATCPEARAGDLWEYELIDRGLSPEDLSARGDAKHCFTSRFAAIQQATMRALSPPDLLDTLSSDASSREPLRARCSAPEEFTMYHIGKNGNPYNRAGHSGWTNCRMVKAAIDQQEAHKESEGSCCVQ